MTGLIGLLTGAHVLLGTVAVASGAIALAVRKGAANHINSGRIFAAAMGLASALGAILGLVKFDSLYITFHAGVLGLTLIASSWLTVRARSARLGVPGIVVSAANILNMLGLIAAGYYALSLPESVLFGFHAGDYFFLSGMAGIAAGWDISLIFRKALSQRHRTARHLWRMCLGFFIAAGSAFTGPGAVVFPKAIQESGILSAPELIIISLMLFWLIRIVFGRSNLPLRAVD